MTIRPSYVSSVQLSASSTSSTSRLIVHLSISRSNYRDQFREHLMSRLSIDTLLHCVELPIAGGDTNNEGDFSGGFKSRTLLDIKRFTVLFKILCVGWLRLSLASSSILRFTAGSNHLSSAPSPPTPAVRHLLAYSSPLAFSRPAPLMPSSLLGLLPHDSQQGLCPRMHRY